MHTKHQALGLACALALGSAGILGATGAHARALDIRIPAGTQIVGTLQQPLSTKQNNEGDRVTLRTEAPLEIGNATLPSGMLLTGQITKSHSGNHLVGEPSITISFDRLQIGGRDYAISTVPFKIKGKSSTGKTAKKVGAGAVVGGVIGAVAGSAAKGAVVGAVLGTGVAVATNGNDLEVPAGNRLSVQLARPVTVRN